MQIRLNDNKVSLREVIQVLVALVGLLGLGLLGIGFVLLWAKFFLLVLFSSVLGIVFKLIVLGLIILIPLGWIIDAVS